MSNTTDEVAARKRQWDDVAVVILSYLLAVVFTGAAFYKLFAWSRTVEQFERFGYEPWFIFVTVLVELAAALLIAMRVTRYWGASLIIVTMIAAMLSHLKADEPGEMVAPLVLLILASVVTWLGPLKPAEEERHTSEAKGGDSKKISNEFLLKQIGGLILFVFGIYIGAIALLGSPPWRGNTFLNALICVLAFASAGFGYSLLTSKPKSDAADDRGKSNRANPRG
jgi:uncharacterized membrane protein YphA (DoxX/SURF4 family)